jgi:hypothetical protein
MRRTLSACRTGLSVAAAVVLLSACGGSDESDSAASASSETSSSAAESSAPEEGSEFCTEASELLASVDPALSGQAGTDGIGPLLQQTADGIRQIDPPAELADDWTAMADGLEEFGTAFEALDVNDQQSLAQFQATSAQIQGRIGTAAANVQTYLAEECGVDLPSEPASPTS